MSRVSAKEPEEASLEDKFAGLEEIIARLEEEDISLEDAFGAYSQGMELLKSCNDQIDRVEKKVLRLSGQGELEEMDEGTGVSG